MGWAEQQQIEFQAPEYLRNKTPNGVADVPLTEIAVEGIRPDIRRR
jgi:hypothetical protein